MSWDSGWSFGFTTGAAALIGGYLTWKVSSEQQKLSEEKEKKISEIIHLVKVTYIAKLLESEDAKVHHTTEQLLIQRSSREYHLRHFLKECLSKDVEQVAKATTALYLLAKSSEENKAKLLNHNALYTLTQTLGKISNDFDYNELVQNCKENSYYNTVLYRCIGCIFHLTLNDTVNTLVLTKENSCINIFLSILGDHSCFISTDIKRWTTFLIHQLSQCDLHPIKMNLRKWGVIRKATFCIIKTFGELLQTQLCLQIIVQYLNDSVEEIVQVCQEMATLGLLPHLVGLLRCDEEESIIQLSAVIIHHFCCFDLETARLVCTPGIVKILFTVLNSTDASIQKTILRICNYLVVSSTRFRRQLLSYNPMIKKLSICLASGNSDVVYGSLMLLHDLTMPGKKSVQKLIHANHEIIKALVTLSLSSKGEIVQLIAETLGFICSCESLHSLILKYNVVNAILHFAKSGNTNVQFWASALLLNLSMISDEVKEMIIRSGGVHVLLEMAVSGDEVDLPDISTNATKTLVILGFLESYINVKLVSGHDGSIIIDGTEHCPGKPGINLVTLDFINYKYSKGQVIQPNACWSFLYQHFESLKSYPLFAITQGDCTMSNADEEISEIKHIPDLSFLRSPSWCLILAPQNAQEVKYGEDNLTLETNIPLKLFVGSVLKDNFTDPLIDVLLSMPPSSNISKTDELELIEILARHSHQRKCIISTAGFLEYLYELIWSVSSLKSNQLSEPENTTKVAHCIAALKIIHACSIDESSINDLVNRGLFRALQSLFIAIVPSLTNKNYRGGSVSNMTLLEEEQKPAWFDYPMFSKDDKTVETNLVEEFEDVEFQDDIFSNSQHLDRLDFDISDSHDNIFDIFQPAATLSAPLNDELRPRTVTYADDVEYIDHVGLDTSNELSHSPQQVSHRLRADSFIMRSDSRNAQLENYRCQSVLDRSLSADLVEEQPVAAILSRNKRPFSADHQQMRRISRSMSFSMQQAKSNAEETPLPELVNISEVLKQLVRHVVVITYHTVRCPNEETKKHILLAKLLPLLSSILGCLSGTFRHRMGVSISSLLMRISHRNQIVNTDPHGHGVIVSLCSGPQSCILGPDCLEVSNENWFFASVQANQAVSRSFYNEDESHPCGWYYEVTVLTDGIMQIGWANKQCVFNAEKGIGVGDNTESCGYDGQRCKLWHGPSRDIVQNNDYGIEWQTGDVISVVLSWNGTLSFWLNGKDLGVALEDIDTSFLWYPAVSLSIDQRCQFAFKLSCHRHRLPEGYVTVEDEYFRKIKTMNLIKRQDSQTTNYPLITSLRPLPDKRKRQMFLYYEVDVSSFTEMTRINIGFKRINCHETTSTIASAKNSSDVKNDPVRKSEIFTSTEDWIYNVHNMMRTLGHERKVNVIGCGIALQNHLVITKDGEPVYETLIKETLPNLQENLEDALIDLIPFVDLYCCKVNFGQNEFIFEDANSVSFKHKTLDYIRNLITKIDR